MIRKDNKLRGNNQTNKNKSRPKSNKWFIFVLFRQIIR